MISKAPSIALAVLSLGACLAGPVRAQAESPSYTIADVKACSKDALRLCRDKLADISAIEGCMREKFAELSPACQERFKGR